MYLTFNDVAENVFRVHTDGVVMSKKVDLPMGDGIGMEGGEGGCMRG